MRIAHVLTYISADGAFGGPVAVASAQAEELAARGHHVEIFAGWDGGIKFSVPGVKVNLFRVRRVIPAGFSGLASPGLLWKMFWQVGKFDVVHFHLARDLVTLPAALMTVYRRPKVRVHIQSHGMVKPDSRLKTKVFDIGVRSVLIRCQSVLALNEADADRILEVASNPIVVVELPNGVKEKPVRVFQAFEAPEILFLARLHKRKRVMVFARAAEALLNRGVNAKFTVIGPDEGDLKELRGFIARRSLAANIKYEGVLQPGTAPERMSQAGIYVLPSLNEPFPMSVLEALSVGTPVVISDSCHIAKELVAAGAAHAFVGAEEQLEALLADLIVDPDRLRQSSSAGQKLISERYGIKHVVDLLLAYYTSDYTTDNASLMHHRGQYWKQGEAGDVR